MTQPEKESDLKIPEGISLILPCYNEAGNIEAVLQEALKVLSQLTDDFEIIVVDDGSKDRTRQIAEQWCKKEPRIKLKIHPKNLGYGSALRTGFQSAQKKWLFFTDADQQFQLKELNKFLPYLTQCPMVIGYRAPRRDPLLRVIYGELFSWLIRVLFRIKAKDVNCAFKIFDRKIIAGENLISSGALINAELLRLARHKGINPVQLPVSHFPRKLGHQTGGNLKVILRAGKELVRLFFHRPCS